MLGRTADDLGSSSRKRARRPEEDNDDESDEVVSSVRRARSSLRNENSKRVRLSSPSKGKGKSRRNRDETPVDDDEDAEMEDSPVNNSPPKTEYDDMRDDDFKHLEHADEDDARATQNIIRTQAEAAERLGDNLIAQNGILESITCVNFMCHERLHVELGPLLNFIVGENGSGKSAILTAITLCLGGKASATNRGGSLKSFIKEGCDRASLSVKLKNMGDDAYRPDLYGDSIIVERTFSKTGTSGFKVKSAEGQVISTKKSEVDEVVEFYALQVDNPLNILSQDNARQFLNASSASEKYRYFIEGVQLEQLDRDYRLISEFVESSEAKAPLQKERVAIAKKEYDEACRLAELANNSRRLKEKLRVMAYQLCWAQVTDQEKGLAEMDQQLEVMDQEIADHQQTIFAYDAKMEEYDATIAEKQKVHEAAVEEAGQFDASIEELKASFEAAQRLLSQMHNDERNAHTSGKAAKNEVKRLQMEINKEKATLEQRQGDEFVRQREQHDESRERQKQLEEEIAAIRDHLKDEVNEKCQTSQANLNAVKRAFEDKQKAIRNTEETIRRIEGGQGGKYDAYDRNMPDLVRAIQREGGWATMPIGPIGTHVQILKPIWSPMLEKTFGSALNDFIVFNLEDSRRLQRLMEQRGIKNSAVLIANGHHIDTRSQEPDPQFETVLRVLKFDNDVVRSQLIISHSIEQIILVPERVKAEEIMFNGPAPPKVKMCFSFHDTRRNQGLVLKNSGRNISTNPAETDPNRTPRMKASQDSALSAQREILESLRVEYRDLGEQRDRLEEEHRANLNEIKRKTAEKKDLDLQLKALEKKIDVIAQKLDSFEGADTRLKNLETEIKEQEETADHFATQYGEMRVKKETQNTEVEAKRQAYLAEKRSKKECERKVRDAEAEVHKWQTMRNLCLTEKNAIHENLDSAIHNKQRLQEKREVKEQQVQDFTAQAAAQHPRVHIPEDETHESLAAQHTSLRRQIKELERQNNITDKEAYELKVKTKAIYDKVAQDYEVATTSVDRLKQTLAQRLNKWRLMQRFISAHARGSFAILLRARRFRGKLMINHKEKQLSLRVEPDKTQKNSNGQSTKTLSGGEKSFSSICLLLSIWESMGAPLRCLDEFDVFMDNVNRAVSTKMLMTAARRSVGRQYIFITPNAIDGKNSLDKDVKIIRLGDPRQRRLADP
ncbi:P-loop containing nucleoside triphosphate hydrolase protein [Coniochaeta sp. 2T2.1]|nr:P-loop containing nucleoside triphosphate hydrolase protein [Coniochaeta sp. 2T2.1]